MSEIHLPELILILTARFEFRKIVKKKMSNSQFIALKKTKKLKLQLPR